MLQLFVMNPILQLLVAKKKDEHLSSPQRLQQPSYNPSKPISSNNYIQTDNKIKNGNENIKKNEILKYQEITRINPIITILPKHQFSWIKVVSFWIGVILVIILPILGFWTWLEDRRASQYEIILADYSLGEFLRKQCGATDVIYKFGYPEKDLEELLFVKLEVDNEFGWSIGLKHFVEKANKKKTILVRK